MITRREILRRLAIGGLVSPLLLREMRAAIDFNGSTDYYEVARAVAGMPLTMACWFRPDDATSTQILMSISTQAGTGRLQLVNAGAVGAKIQAGAVGNITGDSTATTIGSGYSAGVWSHACGVFASAASRTAYLNGGNAASSSVNVGTMSPDRTNIAARWVSGAISLPYAGMLAEVAIWAAALTAAEVYSQWKGVSPLKVRPQSLVLYCPLIRGPLDLRGNGLTAGGSPAVAAHPRIYR